MELKKNDIVTILIEDMGTDGEGIGKHEGYTLFVKDAVIGDMALVKVMKMKKNYGYARLIELIQPSGKRVEPKCSVHRQCGGCQLQALSYPEQLIFKENKLRSNLQRIGHLDSSFLEPVIGMDQPFFYRNKAQFPIGEDKEGNPVAGFYAGRTHDIIAQTRCYLGDSINETILNIILSFMKENHIRAYDENTGKGLIRHVLIRKGFTTKEVMVCLILNGTKLPHSDRLIDDLVRIPGMTSISLNSNQERTNVILGKEVKVLWGAGYISDYIGDICYRISPLSFFQVNPVQTRKLYDKVVEYAGLTGKEIVWDLYCGIGTISLYLAGKARQVYGVEIIPQAIEDAQENARINGITNAKFYVGKAEEVIPELYKKDGIHADVIVVDPPRKGCDGVLLDTILKMSPQKIVYVSCDSATLARDLKMLCENGYKVVKGCGVDQFPMTVHVECIILMTYCGDRRK